MNPTQYNLNWLSAVAPLAVGGLVLAGWEAACKYADIPAFLLPAPSAIARTLFTERAALGAAWLVTVRTMLAALAVAIVGGVCLAALFASSRWLELSLFPYAVVLQVTPLLALAPLLLVWIGTPWIVTLLCALIVAFFPILSGTTLGLRSSAPGLRDLFTLYGASRWQRLRLLLVPSALPYFLAGLKVAVNLSLVGAVVAEFVTGAATEAPGLATLVFEGQFRSDADRTFAALALISGTGIASYFAVHALSRWLLAGWHESGV